MIKNEDQFDLMFMEGLRESEANFQDKILSSDKQKDFINTKQQIAVGNRQFEFTQYDSIFNLTHSPFLAELSLPLDADESSFKKRLQTLYPEKLPSCFCCGKDVFGGITGSKKVKIDACHFCTKWGCDDCVYKTYPFPQTSSGSSEPHRGRICRVCETKFYIKNVSSFFLTPFRNLMRFSE